MTSRSAKAPSRQLATRGKWGITGESSTGDDESNGGERRSGCGSIADKPRRPLALTKEMMTTILKSENEMIQMGNRRTAVSTMGLVESDVLEDSTRCGRTTGQSSNAKTLVATDGAFPFVLVLRVKLLWVVPWPTANSSPPVLVVSVAVKRS